MAKLITVYKTPPSNVLKTIQLLQSHNLHPKVADETEKTGTYKSQQVRIAVPENERETAINILKKAEPHSEKHLSKLVKENKRTILLVIAVLAFIAIVRFLDKQGNWFNLIMLIVTIGFALIRWFWLSKF